MALQRQTREECVFPIISADARGQFCSYSTGRWMTAKKDIPYYLWKQVVNFVHWQNFVWISPKGAFLSIFNNSFYWSPKSILIQSGTCIWGLRNTSREDKQVEYHHFISPYSRTHMLYGTQAVKSLWIFTVVAMINWHTSTPFLALAPDEDQVQRESPVVHTASPLLATSLITLSAPKNSKPHLHFVIQNVIQSVRFLQDSTFWYYLLTLAIFD